MQVSNMPSSAEQPSRSANTDSAAAAAPRNDKSAGGSWKSMPHKSQLALIVLARFVGAVSNSSLQSYIIFQLRSFASADGAPPSTAAVALQLSILRACVAFPGLFTGAIWGVLADHPRVGRKRVILISLVTGGLSSLAFGFVRSFPAAVALRLLSGLTGGNKPAMRSMIRELSGDAHESRAVLLLPAAFNVGSILGPVLGGLLAQGGVNAEGGGGWLPPFLLPNAVRAGMKLSCAALLAWQLRETLPADGGRRAKRRVSLIPGWMRKLYKTVAARKAKYEPVASQDYELGEGGTEIQQAVSNDKHQPQSIWTVRLLLTLAARALLVMHVFAYPQLLLVFTSTPRYVPAQETPTAGKRSDGIQVRNSSTLFEVPTGYHPHLPFTFTGGLSFRPHDIAAVLAMRGLVGLLLQLLFFPRLRDRFGTLRLYRYALVVFPATYFFTPYLTLLPSSTAAPSQPASGVVLWAVLTAIIVVQSTARSLALPAGQMLLNAACPDKLALATVQGIGQSVTSASRGLGQLLMTGWLYGLGLNAGVVGAAWWGMASVAVTAAMAAACVPE